MNFSLVAKMLAFAAPASAHETGGFWPDHHQYNPMESLKITVPHMFFKPQPADHVHMYGNGVTHLHDEGHREAGFPFLGGAFGAPSLMPHLPNFGGLFNSFGGLFNSGFGFHGSYPHPNPALEHSLSNYGGPSPLQSPYGHAGFQMPGAIHAPSPFGLPYGAPMFR